jgi:hypothetical protein
MTDQLKNLTIRTGVVQQSDTGYLLACDPTTEENDPHVKILKWHRGTFSDNGADFSAHTACLTIYPEALVYMSIRGHYGVYANKRFVGNVFENSQPPPKEPRYGDMASVSEIGGKATQLVIAARFTGSTS